ncbi:hypothetical protein KDA14_00085 [Candidatus Saccharibacteria bacterium]|nr:hypothetical protein [Candidatus Saccharibacteria bacterium]
MIGLFGVAKQVAALKSPSSFTLPTTNMAATRSPAAGQSDNGSVPWHTLILSDHGRVQSIDLGMYFKTQTAKTFSFNISPGPGDCNINAVSGYGNGKNYLYYKIGTQNWVGIKGNDVCRNLGGSGGLDNSTFTIPLSEVKANFKGTAKYGTKVTFRWVDGSANDISNGSYNGIRNDIASAAGGDGSNVRFRIIVPGSGSEVGYIDTNSSNGNNTNNSIVHNAVGGNDFDNMYYPFGLRCDGTPTVASNSNDNGLVSVYDADNGSPSQDPSLFFFVGKVAQNDTRVVPLKRGEYFIRNGNIWTNEVPSKGYRNPPNTQLPINPTLISYPDGDNVPVFTPSGFNNAGGVTQVKIDTVQPRTHYVLVIGRMHAGQFVYVGLPGDAIFGSPDFDYDADCPTGGSLSCDALTVTPGTVVDTATDVHAKFDVSGSPPVSNVNMNLSVSGPSGFSQSQNVAQAGNPPYSVDYDVGNLPRSGPYVLSATASYVDTSTGVANSTEPCTATVVVANRPYFQITGGDILSGDSIRSWNLNGKGLLYSGGNSQLGALASNRISDFATGTGLSALGGGTGLAFANTTAVPPDIYGGGYQITPFLPFLPAQTSTLSGTVNLGALSSQIYYATTNLTLHGQLPTGVRATIVMTSGDAFIDGSITYGAYGSTTQIPRLKLYVTNGDIVVRHDVSELHGVFYASGAGKGRFYSCGNNSGGAMDMNLATAFQDCNTKLVVYGSVSANQLVLNRTYGDISGYPSFPQEPAEEFIYSPELWLAPPDNPSGSNDVQYDSFVSLPPVL